MAQYPYPSPGASFYYPGWGGWTFETYPYFSFVITDSGCRTLMGSETSDDADFNDGGVYYKYIPRGAITGYKVRYALKPSGDPGDQYADCSWTELSITGAVDFGEKVATDAVSLDPTKEYIAECKAEYNGYVEAVPNGEDPDIEITYSAVPWELNGYPYPGYPSETYFNPTDVFTNQKLDAFNKRAGIIKALPFLDDTYGAQVAMIVHSIDGYSYDAIDDLTTFTGSLQLKIMPFTSSNTIIDINETWDLFTEKDCLFLRNYEHSADDRYIDYLEDNQIDYDSGLVGSTPASADQSLLHPSILQRSYDGELLSVSCCWGVPVDMPFTPWSATHKFLLLRRTAAGWVKEDEDTHEFESLSTPTGDVYYSIERDSFATYAMRSDGNNLYLDVQKTTSVWGYKSPDVSLLLADNFEDFFNHPTLTLKVLDTGYIYIGYLGIGLKFVEGINI